jgi:hypothetical protein
MYTYCQTLLHYKNASGCNIWVLVGSGVQKGKACYEIIDHGGKPVEIVPGPLRSLLL